MDIADLGFRVNTDGIKKGKKALDDLDKSGKRVGETSKKSGGVIDRSMRAAALGIGAASTSSKTLLGSMGALKGVLGTMGLISIARNAISMGVAFDSSMNIVRSKLLISKDAMKELREQAKKLGSETVFSASEAAGAMGYLAQAGLDAQKIYDAMPSTLNLAAAAGLNLSQAADIATNVMGSFNLTVADLPNIMDTLAITSARANTSVEEMAGALLKAGPVAAELGIDLQTVAGMTGQLANAGFKAERAGTIMLNMFTNLLIPVGQGKQAMEELNITQKDLFTTMGDGSLQFKGMGNLMDLLKEKGVGTADTMRIFGRIAGPGMATLLASGKLSLEDLTKSLDANGQSALMAAIRMSGIGGAIDSAKSAWEGLNIEIIEMGGGDIVIKILEKITKGLRYLTTDGLNYIKPFLLDVKINLVSVKDAFVKFGDAVKNSEAWPFKAIRELGVAIQGVGLILSPLRPYIDEIVAGFIALKIAGLALSAVILVVKSLSGAVILLNPVVLAITAVAISAALIYENWDGIAKFFKELWASVKAETEAFLKWWKNATFAEKTIELSTANFTIGRKLIEGFFSWWDSSTLKTHTPEVVTIYIDIARSMANDFINWWDNIDMLAIVADIEFPSLDKLKSKFTGIFDWFKSVGFDISQGLTDGMDGNMSPIAASAKLASNVISTIKDVAQTKSPSRITTQVGRDISQGLADGILDGADASVAAVTELTDAALKEFNRIFDGLEKQYKKLTLSKDAFRAYELGLVGITGAEQRAIITMESKNDALRESNKIIKRVTDEILNQSKAQYLQNIELSQGADAARFAELTMSGYSDAQARNAIETANNMKFQKEFYTALVDSIKSASDVKEFFNEMGNWLRDWLKEKIAYFAANQIMVGLGLSGGTGVLAGVGGLLGSGGAANSAAAASDGIGTVAAGGGSFFSQIAAATSTAVSAAAIAAIGYAIGKSAVGTDWQKTGGGFDIGYSDGAVFGQSFINWEKERELWRGTASEIVYDVLNDDVRNSVIDYFADLTTTITDQAGVLSAAGADGILEGFTVAVQKFEGAHVEDDLAVWLETATRKAYETAYGNLDPAIQALIDQSVNLVSKPLTDVSDAFLGIGETATQSTLAEIEAAFQNLHDVAIQVIPTLKDVGIQLSSDYEQSIVIASGLSDSMGGVSTTLERLTLFANEFVPQGERVNAELEKLTGGVGDWNESIGNGNLSMSASQIALLAYTSTLDLNTTAGVLAAQQVSEFTNSLDTVGSTTVLNKLALDDYISSLDLSTESGRLARDAAINLSDVFTDTSASLIVTRDGLYEYIKAIGDSTTMTTEAKTIALTAAFEQMDAIIALEDAARQSKITLDTVTEASKLLNLNFDVTSPLVITAANSLVELMGGLEAFSAATQTYFNTFYTLQEQQDLALAQAAGAVFLFNEQLGLAGDAAIDTREEFRTYVEALDLTTIAGQNAFVAAMAVAESMGVVVESEKSLTAVIDTLPINLQESFVLMQSSADVTAESVATNAQTITNGAIAINEASLSMGATNETIKTGWLSTSANIAKTNDDINNNYASLSQNLQSTNSTIISNWQNAGKQISAANDSINNSNSAMAATIINGANGINSAVGVVEKSLGRFGGAMQNVAGAASSAAGIAGAGARTSANAAGQAVKSANAAASASQGARDFAQSAKSVCISC